MATIFWGLVFVLFDFNITVGDAVVGLLPDFFGYALVFIGARRLSREYEAFTDAWIFALALAVAELAIWIFNLDSHFNSSSVWVIIVTAVGLAAALAQIRLIIRAVAGAKPQLSVAAVTKRWVWLLCSSCVGFVLSLFNPLVLPAVLLQAVVAILFLIEFYRLRRAFIGTA